MRGIAGSCGKPSAPPPHDKDKISCKRAGGCAREPGSTLPGLEAALDLVDHVDAAFAADQAIAAMAAAQRFQRVADFHDSGSRAHGRAVFNKMQGCAESRDAKAARQHVPANARPRPRSAYSRNESIRRYLPHAAW